MSNENKTQEVILTGAQIQQYIDEAHVLRAEAMHDITATIFDKISGLFIRKDIVAGNLNDCL